jgi:hypothetical protein
LLAGEGGYIDLKDPDKKEFTLHYFAIGAGVSAGSKVTITANRAPSWYPNSGKIFIQNSFPGKELRLQDVPGTCYFAEAGTGVSGLSGTVMLLGMLYLKPVVDLSRITTEGPIAFLVNEITGRPLDEFFVGTAKAAMVVGDINSAVQAGGGATGFMGFVW